MATRKKRTKKQIRVQYERQNDWIGQNRDRINLNTPKGDKDRWKAAATRAGESMNAMIRRAVEKLIQEEGLEEPLEDIDEDQTEGQDKAE